MDSKQPDLGQAVMLLLVVVVMAALGVVGTGVLAERIADRATAQTAADAAALAAISGGRPAAVRLAVLNGGRLIGFVESGAVVTVVVEVDGQRATARATDGP